MKRIANASPAAQSLAMITKPRRRSAIATLFAAVIALLLLVLPSFASADPLGETTMFKEFLRPSAFVLNMSPGPDGNVWFTDSTLPPAAIGKITPGGTITEYVSGENLSGLNEGSKPISITAGPGGEKYLWFTDNGLTPAIGYVDSASPETAAEISLKAGSEPQDIVAGPGGKLWFTDEGTTPAIVAVDPSSKEVVKECTGGELEAESLPQGIVVGSDGNLWFVDNGPTPAIGKVDPNTCAITEFPTGVNSDPGGGAGAQGRWGIGSGADGNVWFTEGGANEANGKAVCRIETSGENKIKCFKTGLLATSSPTSMTSAPDGNGKLWFIDNSGVNEAQELKIEATENLGGTYKLGFGGEETGAVFTGSLTSASPKIKSISTSSGVISKGERVTGTGIPAGATVKKVIKATEIELTANATETKTGVSFSADLPYNASSGTILEALWKLPAIGEENVGVENGTTETNKVVRPYHFETALGATDVEQMSCNGASLTGTSPTCTVTTTEQGVPNEIDSIDTSGSHEITRYPRSQLLRKGNAISNGPGGNVWFSVGFLSSAEIGKFGIGDTNRRTLTLTKSAGGTGGTGTVTSKPKGINCGTACNSAVASMYENSTVVLKAKASTGSTIAGWTGCESSTGVGGIEGTCTVKMPEAKVNTEVKVAWSGTSKAIAEAKALTLSKGEGSGYGTVKATGLTCEAECTEEVALYQGPNIEKAKPGKTVILKATPAYGSTLSGWTGCESNPTPAECSVTMESAKSVTAEFAAKPTATLTVDKLGTGTGTVTSKPKAISCATTCTTQDATVPQEAEVILKEKPALGMTFEGWTGACVGAGETCSVSLTVSGTVHAKFSGAPKAIANAQELTLNKGGSGYGTVKATGLTCEALCTSTVSLYQGPNVEKAKPGKTVILKALSAPGSKQVEWTGCESNPTPTECSVVMEEAKTVTATFDELE